MEKQGSSFWTEPWSVWNESSKNEKNICFLVVTLKHSHIIWYLITTTTHFGAFLRGVVMQLFYELPLPQNRHSMVSLTAGGGRGTSFLEVLKKHSSGFFYQENQHHLHIFFQEDHHLRWKLSVTSSLLLRTSTTLSPLPVHLSPCRFERSDLVGSPGIDARLFLPSFGGFSLCDQASMGIADVAGVEFRMIFFVVG